MPIEDRHRMLQELKERAIPVSHQLVMLQVLEEYKEELKREFNPIFSFNYPRETQLVLLEAESYDFGLGFAAYPYKRATESVVPRRLITSGSVGFHNHLDDEDLDEDGDYLIFSEKLFVKWLGRILNEFREYKDFPYRIAIFYRGGTYSRDIATGELIKE
ncbi:hypothetical protein ACGF5C_28370 [Micromonospora sp. NPDC047620]|uniref:hypothetical protein n=1 Tax=Micromonospora sp. NPDC047620 TaxID=3364251 RepID=UPI003721A93E